MTITYNLIFVSMLGFPARIDYWLVYIALFTASYTATAVMVGRWDYRRGAVPVEAELVSKANPWVKDLAGALILLSENKREEAKKLLEKWSGR